MATLTLMETSALPGSILVICGASGAVGAGVTATAFETALSLALLTAISDIKYSVSLVSPAIVIGLESPVAAKIAVLVSVIFDSVFELVLDVYTLPSVSTAIPRGLSATAPRVPEFPSGVIFDTLSVSQLAV